MRIDKRERLLLLFARLIVRYVLPRYIGLMRTPSEGPLKNYKGDNMVLRKLFFVLAVLLCLSGNAFAWDVDEALLYQVESKYVSSKWTLDLSATGNDDGTSEKSTESLKTDVGLSTIVEKIMTGYWLDADIELTVSRKDDGNQDTEKAALRIKNFEENAVGGFEFSEFADAGYKLYFSDQSPYFVFGQCLGNWYVDHESPENEGGDSEEGLELFGGGGVGYGKIVDLGSYERVLIVQNELMKAGLIDTNFTRSTIVDLLPWFRYTMERYYMLTEVQKILINRGLINEEGLTLNIAGDMLDAIDEAFEKRKYGLEIRAAYLQKLVHRDSDRDKNGWLSAYVRYELPLGENHQFTSRCDLYQQVMTDNDDKTTQLGWLNSITSTFGAHTTTELGIGLGYRKTTDTDTSEKIYGKLEYELTDVIKWVNDAEYTMYQYGAKGAGDNSEYKVTSTLTYTIW